MPPTKQVKLDDEKKAMLWLLMLTDCGAPGTESHIGKSVFSKFLDSVRHPLVLLLISSAIIPAIVYCLTKQRDLATSRQKAALEIVGKNSIFEGELYGLYTELGVFHQTNQVKKPSPDDLRKIQTDLDKSWNAHYLEFRKAYPDAHIWVDDLFGQAVVLKLFSSADVRTLLSAPDSERVSTNLPADLKSLSADIDEYKGTIGESLEELRKLRDRCISNAYDFEPTGTTSKIQIETTKRLNELRDQRTLILTNIAAIFSR